MTSPRTPGPPAWPEHQADAPSPEDPRSLARGLTAGVALLVIAVALALIGPWSLQTRILMGLLGWIAAVVVGLWAYRGESRYAIAATRIAVAVAVVTLSLTMALILVGAQVRDILAGTVVFGAGGVDCTLEDEAETFVLGQPVYAVAHTDRRVEAGEEITMLVTWEGQLATEGSETSPRSFDCLGSSLDPPRSGSYSVVVSAGAETLAEGTFEVAPDLE